MDLAAGARQEVGRGVRPRPRQRLAQPSRGVRGHHDPAQAAAPDHVPLTPDERAQLASQRRRRALAHVVAARRAALAVGRPGQRRQRRVRGGAPVLEPGRCEIADDTAGRGVAPLPVLLVPGPVHRLVEAAGPVERAPAQRHVGAPDERHVAVGAAQIERGDRRVLAPARARAAALEPGADRPAEDVDVGGGRGAGEHGLEPPGGRRDVVVDRAARDRRGRRRCPRCGRH